MQVRALLATALLATGLGLAPAHAGDTDCFGLRNVHCAASVQHARPSWVLVGTERSTRATLERRAQMPAVEVDGARVQLRIRLVADGSEWEVLDESTLHQVAGEPDQYAARLTYAFRRVGHYETRVRTLLDGRWFLDRPRLHRVTEETAPHAPQALDRAVRPRHLVMDAALTRAAWTGRSRVFWTTDAIASGDPRSFAGRQPDWADDTRRFVASRTVLSEDAPVGRRVVLVDARTGRRTPVALDADGDPVRFSAAPSIDDGAQFVAYTSRSHEIVTPSPPGRKVFVANTSTGTSRLLAPGRKPAISGNARFVAYVTDTGIVLRDRAEHTTATVTGYVPIRLRDLTVADDGLVVWSQHDGRPPQRRSVFYWDGGDVEVLGEGSSPTLSDDGHWVFYPGVVGYGDGGYAGVVRRDPRTGSKETVTFGPTGRASATRVVSLNTDPTGRFVVVGGDGGREPLAANVGAYRSVRFDLDAP